MTADRRSPTRDTIRRLFRLLLGVFLGVAGVLHLIARETFHAQVPAWVPMEPDLIVVASGIVEIALGLALLLPHRRQQRVGWLVAAFFLAVFPGNVAQYLEGTDAFGLTTDRARLLRLFFQPVLIAWALWSTGAWHAWRDAARADATR